MEKDVIVSITDELYHLTLLFPKKEPLKYKMREQANAILEVFVCYFKERKNGFRDQSGLGETVRQGRKYLEAIDCNFEIVKRQNWVSLSKVLVLKGRYLELMRLLEEVDSSDLVDDNPVKFEKIITQAVAVSSKAPENELSEETTPIITNTKPLILDGQIIQKAPIDVTKINERQKKILSILKNKDKAQVWEFKTTFPDVSKRTLRRDFEYLYNQGMVERVGEKNNTFYQLYK